MKPCLSLLCVLAVLPACASSSDDNGGNPEVVDVAAASAARETLRPPLSARVAVQHVLELLEEQGSRTGAIELHGLEAAYGIVRKEETERIDVELDLSFLADDILDATRTYTDLLGVLETTPWCLEVQAKATKALEGGRGIHVAGLRLQVVPPPVDAPPEGHRPRAWSEDPGQGEVIFLVVSAAVQDQASLGQVNTTPAVTNPYPGVEDFHVTFKPFDRKTAYGLQAILNFATFIEGNSGGDVVVTNLRLRPAAKTLLHERVEDRWTYNGTATYRHPVE